MRDFLDGLDDRLTAIVLEEPEAVAAPARQVRRRRPVLLGGLTASIAALAAAFTMVGTSAAELPILSTGTTDASRLVGKVPAIDKRGVDYSKAHVFGTPGGPGYVLVNDDSRAVCLALPDSETPGEFGGACSRSIDTVERNGLMAFFSGDTAVNPAATTLFAFVLPDRAKDIALTVGGRATTPQIESGVVSATVSGDARLSWSVDGNRAARTIRGPFKTTGITVDCGGGRVESIPMIALGGGREATNEAFAKARKEACR